MDQKFSKDKTVSEINEVFDDWETLTIHGERIFKENSKVSRVLVAMSVPHPTLEEEINLDCLAMSSIRGKILFFDLKMTLSQTQI